MSLEESLAAYERGVGLYRRCQAALEQAELRVRLLSDPEQPGTRRTLRADARWKLTRAFVRWAQRVETRARPGPAFGLAVPATPARRDAPCRAGWRQAHASAAGIRHRQLFGTDGTLAGRARHRGRADPRLLAGARRPARHGRRRAASRAAHRACRLRRGHRDPRWRCLAVAGLRDARPRAGRVRIAVALLRTLAPAAGAAGMCGGQALDLAATGQTQTLPASNACTR